MHLYEVIWKDRFVDKIAEKHGVTTNEVEEILFSEPLIRLAERGRVKGEDLYVQSSGKRPSTSATSRC